MPAKQGDLELLHDPVAKELLNSNIPARLAYVGRDGKPRVVPIWFHWNEKEIVLGTPVNAPKVRALLERPDVVVSIDSHAWPYKVLQIRGVTKIETVQGVPPEYATTAERYFGETQGKAWVEQLRKLFPQMTRIAVQPRWVGILDFEARFPRAIAAAMSAAQG